MAASQSICRFNLVGNCRYGINCRNLHMGNEQYMQLTSHAYKEKIANNKRDLSLLVKNGSKINIYIYHDVYNDINYITKLLSNDIDNPTMDINQKNYYKQNIIKILNDNHHSNLFLNINFAYWLIDNISWRMVKYLSKFYHDIDFVLYVLSIHYKARHYVLNVKYMDRMFLNRHSREIELAIFKGRFSKKSPKHF